MNEAPIKSWILSNFETLANILIFIFVVIVLLQSWGKDDINFCMKFFISLAIFVFGGSLSETSNTGFSADLIRLLFSVCVVVAFFILASSLERILYYQMLASASIAAITGGFIACVCSRFVYINFEDVVSRRMRYRNSNVDLFENRWKYAFNRFVVIFSYFIIFIPLITLFLMDGQNSICILQSIFANFE